LELFKYISLLFSIILSAETITYSGDYSDENLIDAAGMNSLFSLVYTLLNGNLDSSNLTEDSIESSDLAIDSDSLFEVSGGVMVSSGDKIGIGTDNPQAFLHIKEIGRTTNVIVDQDGSNNSFIGFSDNGEIEWHIG